VRGHPSPTATGAHVCGRLLARPALLLRAPERDTHRPRLALPLKAPLGDSRDRMDLVAAPEPITWSLETVFERTEPEPNSGCWLWALAWGEKNYARSHRNRRSILASRQTWELAYGPIPAGLCVLHRCDNPPCVNPAHLFLGTQADNLRDMVSKGRQNFGGSAAAARKRATCAAGHSYDDGNLYVTSGGKRDCRACGRERKRRRTILSGGNPLPRPWQRKRPSVLVPASTSTER
jgi:hypothetical protein